LALMRSKSDMSLLPAGISLPHLSRNQVGDAEAAKSRAF
jgi:hypothetical protein